jgi:HlyD family secretion protein
VRINPDLYQSAVDRAHAAVLSAKANSSNSKARLSQAEAQFIVAEKSYNRNKNLHQQGAISDSEFEQAESAFQVAKAETEAAKESVKGAQYSIESAEASYKEATDNLKRTNIFAPIDGIVTGLVVEAGERVVGTGMMGGTELMRISNLSAMEVNVEVNESDIVKVNLGDTALIEVDAYLNEKFKGVVTEIGNIALNSLSSSLSMDQVTNFSVKISILPESYTQYTAEGDSSISPFRPGMSATVDIMTARADNALSISIKAVTTREDTASSGLAKYIKKSEEEEAETEESEDKEAVVCVFVHKDGEAKLQVVETGIQDNKFIQILSGIQEGEQVITGPYEAVSRSLKNGSNVKISKTDRDKENAD